MTTYIHRYNALQRVLHWTVAASFFVLLLSGLGLFAHAFYKYFDFFGGAERGILFHKWAGIIFLVSSILLFLGNVREVCRFDKDDARWFAALGGYLSRKKPHLPQGKYNAGQKLFGIFSILATLTMAATGLVIWDATAFDRNLTQFSLMLHGLFFILFMMFVIVHIYLGSIGNPGTIEGMLWGRVKPAWAKKHAIKWYKEIMGEK
ncbi:MAG TPA: formate dehydrogenase subunit gamma [Malonomonas sp.]